jgi:hypothetical protein
MRLLPKEFTEAKAKIKKLQEEEDQIFESVYDKSVFDSEYKKDILFDYLFNDFNDFYEEYVANILKL